mgnify:CR=1 FL=1
MNQANFPKVIKIILVVSLVVIVAGGIFYFWSQNNKGAQNLSTSGNSLSQVSTEQVLNSLDEARTKSMDAKRIADIGAIRTKLEAYRDSHNDSYPESLQMLDKTYSDPSTNQLYFYARCEAQSYHLGANLETNYTTYLQSDDDKGPMCSGDKIEGADNKGCDGTNGLFCYDFAF